MEIKNRKLEKWKQRLEIRKMDTKKYEIYKKIGLALIGLGTAVYLLGLIVFRGILKTYLYIEYLYNYNPPYDPLPPLYSEINAIFYILCIGVGIPIFFTGVGFLDQSLRKRRKKGIERGEQLEKTITNYHNIGISLILTGFIILVFGSIGTWIILGYYSGWMALPEGLTIGGFTALLWFLLLCTGLGINSTSRNLSKWKRII